MGPQLGNDLYQAMNTSHGNSRGRGYSGSLYGGHQSNNTNTHHPSMLAMDAVDDDEMEEENHHNGVAANYGNRDYHVINPMRGGQQ